MATGTHTLLERITVGEAGAALVTFSSIPQTGYTDLKIVASTRDNSASTLNNMYLVFNGSTSGYSNRTMIGQGTGTPVSYAASSLTQIEYTYSVSASSTASIFANTEYYIPNYTSSNYKSISIDNVTENNATAAWATMTTGLWSNSAAISSIKFTSAGGELFTQYSTFSLYGIAASGVTPTLAPKAVGGDIIQTDGTYWYHTFINTGTFTPALGLTCDVLVVAGGGGAGGGTSGSYGGGGGAGGMLTSTSYSTASGTPYTVTIGAGGTGGTINTNPRGGVGINSVFDTLTATSGGGGGSGFYTNFPNAIATGGDGGSGGGSGYATIIVAGGTGTSGQGNNGASYNTGGQAAGGGGKGSAGSANNGGTGASNSYSGSAVTYAAGGHGGGGAANSPNATANTGNGGDINTTTRYGMNGGSGVVIIRYAV